MRLNRDMILAAKPRTSQVTIEGWGGEVLVKNLSVKQLLEITEAKDSQDQIQKFTHLIADNVCDEDGHATLSFADVTTMEVATVLAVGKAIISANNASIGQDEGGLKNS